MPLLIEYDTCFFLAKYDNTCFFWLSMMLHALRDHVWYYMALLLRNDITSFCRNYKYYHMKASHCKTTMLAEYSQARI